MTLKNLLPAIVASVLLAVPAAAGGPVVSAGEGPVSISVGQTVALAVKVADVEDLYGFDVQLRFDPSVVEAVDADPNAPGLQAVAGDFLSPDFVVRNTLDTVTGTGQFAVTQVNPSEPKSGSGTLFTIYLSGVAADRTSPVEVTEVILATRDGDVIPVSLANGEIRVQSTSVVASSPTPTPPPGLPTETLAATTPPLPAEGPDAPTATQASVSTPTVAAPESTPASISAAASATQAALSIATVQSQPTSGPLIADVSEPATPAPSMDGIPAAPNAGTPASPAPIASEPPGPQPTLVPALGTPARIAKSASGDSGKAILDRDTAESTGDGQTAQHEQPSYSWLLITAGVLLAMACGLATLMVWLALRRRRA